MKSTVSSAARSSFEGKKSRGGSLIDFSNTVEDGAEESPPEPTSEFGLRLNFVRFFGVEDIDQGRSSQPAVSPAFFSLPRFLCGVGLIYMPNL